jgi:crotonobetainyl-CoA:carnitine CoA-transferase CaiB-like acyl-CoA transferase
MTGATAAAADTFQPLAGIRVVELSQMVMAPTCGLILADLGADVVKVVATDARSRRPPGA